MFKDRSKVLFAGALLSTIYILYLIVYFSGATETEDTAEAIGGAIATALVMPHMVVMGLGAIFSWLGFFFKNNWGPLVAAILFAVGLILFPLYFYFSVPLIILGFVGYAKQKKMNNIKA